MTYSSPDQPLPPGYVRLPCGHGVPGPRVPVNGSIRRQCKVCQPHRTFTAPMRDGRLADWREERRA